MIRIINLRTYVPKDDEVLVRVDRYNKILGNKFRMRIESERDLVCMQYKGWFYTRVNNKNEKVMAELRRIYKIAKNKDVALGCWCYPKKCHAEIILEFLNKYMEV